MHFVVKIVVYAVRHIGVPCRTTHVPHSWCVILGTLLRRSAEPAHSTVYVRSAPYLTIKHRTGVACFYFASTVLAPNTVVLQRCALLDRVLQFFEQLARCGLTCVEVREPGVPTPPPSPPPLTELFPEMRIAVYDIRLAGQAAGVEGVGADGADEAAQAGKP